MPLTLVLYFAVSNYVLDWIISEHSLLEVSDYFPDQRATRLQLSHRDRMSFGEILAFENLLYAQLVDLDGSLLALVLPKQQEF